MTTYDESPEPQWFEPTEQKCRCGKRATGILRGRRNESFGPHCKACAEKRIKAAKRVREQIAHDTVGGDER